MGAFKNERTNKESTISSTKESVSAPQLCWTFPSVCCVSIT